MAFAEAWKIVRAAHPSLAIRDTNAAIRDTTNAAIRDTTNAAIRDTPAIRNTTNPAARDVADEAAFKAFVDERVDGAELAHRHIADLYLAWACDRGDATALAIFERDVAPIVERSLAKFADRRELMQMLRERMLVSKAGTHTGIAAYDGRAPLATWLRVCATRIGLREQDRSRRSAPTDDGELDQLAPGVPDPQLEYLKRVYGESFRTAFGDAVASLVPRERNLLRLAVLDGLGIDQLAAIFHVHRATAARQLKAARATLVAATRDRMRVALSISESELESIMRMIHSMADITLGHVLRATPRDSE
jgi:RNA polymerase sigma-70 factor, ECF subfamily